MIDSYTRILEAVAVQGDEQASEAAVRKLVAHLTHTGRSKLLPTIVRELRIIQERRKANAPKVEVAHTKEAAKALEKAGAAGIKASEAVVMPSLLAGWRAQGHGLLIDCSGKQALIAIYKDVTA
jgi:hypothetical protein